MNKTIAAITLAASLTAGGLAGVALGVPTVAGAAATATDAAGWVQEALGGLVDDGTITQEQADAVASALRDARPERGMHGGRHLDLSTVAEALGLSEDDLRTALEGGQTIAEVAAAEGVDVQVVVDAIVAAQQERIAEKVEAGELTQDQADDLLANAEARATAMVSGERPAMGGRHHHGPRG